MSDSSLAQGELLGDAIAKTVYPQPEATGLALVVERLAANPSVDVSKLEKIIELQERVLRHQAKAAFDTAFSKMQAALPEIDEKGRIVVKGSLRSTYAKLEDIHTVIKPLLKEYGFAIRHRTEWPDNKDGIVRIVGILSHTDGHSEESAFEAPMDKSEYRTDIQSMGSTISYGRRYTTIDLLNLTTRAQDDDGASAGRPEPPDEYMAFLAKLTEAAEGGTKKFEAVWKDATPEFKNYTVKYNRAGWDRLKARSREVGA